MNKLLAVVLSAAAVFSAFAAPQKPKADPKVVGVATLKVDGSDRFLKTEMIGNWEAQNVSGEGAQPGKPNLPKDGEWGVARLGNSNGTWFKNRQLDNVEYATKDAPAAKFAKDRSVWYRRTLKVPAIPAGRRIRFVSECRRLHNVFAARLYVNGKFVQEPIGPDVNADITDFLKVGDNEISLYFSGLYKGTEQTAVGITTHPMPGDLFEHPEKQGMSANFAVYALVVPEVTVEGVFAKTSWREKMLTLEADLYVDKDRTITVNYEVVDAAGKVVKANKVEKNVKKGDGICAVEVPWQDPITWEVGRPYSYTCRYSVSAGGKTLDTLPPFTFGFREAWRDGKELMLNGHIQRLRIVYPNGVDTVAGMSFMKMIGYNTIHFSHNFNMTQDMRDIKKYQVASDCGMAACLGAASMYHVRDRMRKDEYVKKQYLAYQREWMKTVRNIPGAFVFYVAVNTSCPTTNMDPYFLGQIGDTNPQGLNLNAGIEIARKANPTVCYFSHADGSVGDMSSNNLYLNMTPLQERSEWLTKWSKYGQFPWQAAEFGQPYLGCWWNFGPNFFFTEWMTEYFGDRAYSEESDICLKMTMRMSLANTGWHGVGGLTEKVKDKDGRKKTVSVFSLDRDIPLWQPFHAMFTKYTNRGLRASGMNGGVLYFNLGGYGKPNSQPWGFYSGLKNEDGDADKPFKGRPKWANADFDFYQSANHDLAVFIGGKPLPTDQTHAYCAGETVKKSAALIWDGALPTTIGCTWKVCGADGKEVAGGKLEKKLQPGDITFEPFEFKAPAVKEKTAYTISAAFTQDGKAVETDAFPIEVYPAACPQVKVSGKVALFDPNGTGAKVLEALGIQFVTVKSLAEAKDAKYVVIGKNGIDQTNFDLTSAGIENGQRVFVMAQESDCWKAFGFDVQDVMARHVFLRDVQSRQLAGITDDMLSNWTGYPIYGDPKRPFGLAMVHDTQRGPRWTRNMVVSGLMIKKPQRAGYVSLIEGEFDMNYSALLRYQFGKGSVTFCTLDFEGRVGLDRSIPQVSEDLEVYGNPASYDPAAAAVAAKVFDDFFNGQFKATDRAVCVDGKAAERLAQDLGYDSVACDQGGVGIVGSDSKKTWADVEKCAKGGKEIFVINNAAIAKAAGLVVQSNDVYRAKFAPDCPWLRALGPQLFRWRDVIHADVITKADGFDVKADGLIARREIGKGAVTFFQFDPYQLKDRWAKAKADAVAKGDKDSWKFDFRIKIVDPSQEHLFQLLGGMMTNVGAKPGKSVTERITYLAPVGGMNVLPQLHVLGPFQSPHDDSKEMLDTVWDELGEKMAKEGDYNPNPRFVPPQFKGTDKWYDWRPIVKSAPDGKIDLSEIRDMPETSCAVSYLTVEIERKEAGEATFMLGCDWRIKAWCNGEEFCRQENGVKSPSWEYKLKLNKGRNVLAFKLGAGGYGNAMWAKLEAEPSSTVKREDREVKGYSLYVTDAPKFDPYTYVFW